MYLLMVILEDLQILPKLLERWREIGVPGTTIIRSMGGFHAYTWLQRVGMTMLGREAEEEERPQRMLISVIDDDDLLERAIAEAESLVGGFDTPHSGILFVLPVMRALGIQKRHPITSEELITTAPESMSRSQWESLRGIPVSKILQVHNLPPAIVHPDDELSDVAEELLNHPMADIACVVNEEGRLVGLLRTQKVAYELLLNLMPEEFLQHMSELEEALEYAELFKGRKAGDLVEEPVSVHPETTVREAFSLMRRHKLHGLPVVDDTNHVIGYINLLQMLVLAVKSDSFTCNESAQ